MQVPETKPEIRQVKQEDEMVMDKDLEYLFQDIIRKPTLDQELKKDLQRKRAESKYLDMLVRTSLVLW